MSVPRGVLVLSTEIVAVDVVTSCIMTNTLTTVDRVVDECTQFLTNWSVYQI